MSLSSTRGTNPKRRYEGRVGQGRWGSETNGEVKEKEKKDGVEGWGAREGSVEGS